MRYLMIVAILVLSTPAHAFEEWDKTEIGMEIAYVGLHLVDWGQTLDIEHHPNLYETNIILGRHPSRAKINAFFSAGVIIQPIIAHYAPDIGKIVENATGLDLGSDWWRKAWIGSGIIIEARCIGGNIKCGVRCAF